METNNRPKPPAVEPHLLRTSQLAKKCNVSRQLVHHYCQLGLIEPDGREFGELRFSQSKVRIMSLIRRLNRTFGYSLDDIRHRIVPIASEKELVRLADRDDKAVGQWLKRKALTGSRPRKPR
jgi:DNA-binding transcriptional MerR regulator